MKPTRLIGILFMVTVLIGMFAVVGLMVGGFAFGVRSMMHDDNGVRVTQAHTDLDSTYKSLSVAGPIDLEWTRDSKVSFDVSGSPDLVKKLEYEFKNGNLNFKLRSNWNFGGSVKVNVHGPQPASFSLAGSGDSTLHGLENGKLGISVAGSGNVDLAGNIDSLEVNVAGSGDVKALDLQCKSADVTVAGSGNVDVNPAVSLRAAIMGSGDVGYKGDPKITKSIMGSGDVEKKD